MVTFPAVAVGHYTAIAVKVAEIFNHLITPIHSVEPRHIVIVTEIK